MPSSTNSSRTSVPAPDKRSPPAGHSCRQSAFWIFGAIVLCAAVAFGGGGGPGLHAIRDDRALEFRLELNGAGLRELEALPGVGPALAARIASRRRAKGDFLNLDELCEVRGVGRKKLASLRPYLVVGKKGGGQ